MSLIELYKYIKFRNWWKNVIKKYHYKEKLSNNCKKIKLINSIFLNFLILILPKTIILIVIKVKKFMKNYLD